MYQPSDCIASIPKLHIGDANKIPCILNYKKILVIEDDYVNFLFIKEIIEYAGGEVYQAITPDDALECFFQNNCIDLIIINNSLTWGAHNDKVHYLKKEYSVPVIVMIDKNKREVFRSQKVVGWVDCAISVNTDVETVYDVLSELAHNN